MILGHITAVIPKRFQASWDEEAVTVCASVVTERENRNCGMGDKLVGRFCNTLRIFALCDCARIEKGCARGRIIASATLRRREERKVDDRPRYSIITKKRLGER
jgi:hypothetical protein